MDTTSVTSKGQVTIPKEIRQRLGIRQGSRIQFRLMGDHVELRVSASPPFETQGPGSGFGRLKSRQTSAPADLDPSTLVAQ